MTFGLPKLVAKVRLSSSIAACVVRACGVDNGRVTLLPRCNAFLCRADEKIVFPERQNYIHLTVLCFRRIILNRLP